MICRQACSASVNFPCCSSDCAAEGVGACASAKWGKKRMPSMRAEALSLTVMVMRLIDWRSPAKAGRHAAPLQTKPCKKNRARPFGDCNFKNFLQGLKPSDSMRFTLGLKPQPPKDSNPRTSSWAKVFAVPPGLRKKSAASAESFRCSRDFRASDARWLPRGARRDS